jgi:MarR family transcriptional regulator, organic hydroperoxide resistance regulator
MVSAKISASELAALLEDPALDFLRVLWTIEHGVQSASKRMEKSHGITGRQRLVLRFVERFPELTPSELAAILQLDPSTITGILQRLIDKGLLSRERDPRDSRRVMLRLRHAAKLFTAPVTGTVEWAVFETLKSMPIAHIEHAREVLLTLAASLQPHPSR